MLTCDWLVRYFIETSADRCISNHVFKCPRHFFFLRLSWLMITIDAMWKSAKLTLGATKTSKRWKTTNKYKRDKNHVELPQKLLSPLPYPSISSVFPLFLRFCQDCTRCQVPKCNFLIGLYFISIDWFDPWDLCLLHEWTGMNPVYDFASLGQFSTSDLILDLCFWDSKPVWYGGFWTIYSLSIGKIANAASNSKTRPHQLVHFKI